MAPLAKSETLREMEKDVDPIPLDWARFTTEFHRRETAYVYADLADCRLVVGERSQASVASAFTTERTWTEAFTVPGQAVLFAYGVFAWGMKEWEYSGDHQSVAEKLDEARTALTAAKIQSEHIRSNPDIPAVDLIMSMADSLKICMQLERTLYTSCLAHFQKLTIRIVQTYEQFMNALDRIMPAALEPTARCCLKEIIETQLCFYSSLTHFGTVALDYRNGAASQLGHDAAIRHLELALSKLTELGPDVLASELLAYRRILIAFHDRQRENKTPVDFDNIRIVYIYPFTIDGLSGTDAYDKTLSRIYAEETGLNERTELQTPRTFALSGVPPRSINEADLTDLWKWRGFRPSFDHELDNQNYGAVDIEMPDLTVTNEDDRVCDGYRAKVRVTTHGNHYVRIEKDLKSPKLYEINEGLRRASSLMSEGAVSCKRIGPWKPWVNLTEYAKSMAAGLSHLFDPDAFAPTSKTAGLLSEIDSCFHVVLEIRSASIGSINGRRDATETQIEEYAASLLLQPLTRMAVAPDEWVCYRSSDWENILTQDSFAVDFAIGTTSTTVLSMPASPDWFYNSYEECIELVVSFVSLVRQWIQEINEAQESIKCKMEAVQADEDPQEFARIRLELYDKIVDIRRRRTFLTPSELVGSGHHRAFLEKLFDIERVSDMLKDLDAQIQIANLVHDRAVEYQRRLFDERQKSAEKARDERLHNYNDVQQALLLFIGFFALAGVVTMFEQELFGASESVWSTSWHPIVNLILTVTIWAAMVPFALMWLRWKRKKIVEPGTPDNQD
jgi:hypothetical protein